MSPNRKKTLKKNVFLTLHLNKFILIIIISLSIETQFVLDKGIQYIFLCGLLVVRYDLNAYTRISSTLHGISDSLGNIGDIRDTSYILMIVTLILTTLLQIVLFVGVYFEKHYLLTSVS